MTATQDFRPGYNPGQQKNATGSASGAGTLSSTDPGFDREWLDESGRADDASADAGGTPSGSAMLADAIRGAATATARAVKEQASAMAGEVGHELGNTAKEQVGRGSEALGGFARAIEAAGAELQDQSPYLARLIGDAADKVRDVSDDLGRRDVDDLIGNLTDLARRQPVVFIGAAVAAGFALARFLKSSSGSSGNQSMSGAPGDDFDD